MRLKKLLSLLGLLFVVSIQAKPVHVLEQIAQLAKEPTAALESQKDWLLDNTGYTAHAYRGKKADELIISNGLISRTFKVSPNLATIAFENLISNASVIRGIKPEAQITLNGKKYDVGGLKGQRNYAFLKQSWIKDLTHDPRAFQFTKLTIGKPKKTMGWKRIRHHDKFAKWPPKGIYVRMDYALPSPLGAAAWARLDSHRSRKTLFTDSFTKLGNGWRVHTSPSHSRSSFNNEGKAGEIYTPANTCVYAQRKLPKGTKLVELQLNAGTDQSSSWGPGIALVFKKRTIKFNLGAKGFYLYNGAMEQANLKHPKFKINRNKIIKIRLMIEKNILLCQAQSGPSGWYTYQTVKLKAGDNIPLAVRIGKLGKKGGDKDFHATGDLVRLKIEKFTAYSALNHKKSSQPKLLSHDIILSVHYELYDGIPVMCKWLTVQNHSKKPIVVNKFTSEILAAVEYTTGVDASDIPNTPPNIHVETDYAFGGFTSYGANQYAVHWEKDRQYRTQVSWARRLPCLLEVRPTVGPEQTIMPNKSFASFRAYILPHDSYDRERQSLSIRRMYRVIAPWTTENPLMMHVRRANWEAVKKGIDQCADVGFEMVILTFGSGFSIENESPKYLAKMKKYADYAKSKGIEIGGYSLLSSRRVGGGNAVVSPKGSRPKFGRAPALTSQWGQDYFRKLYQFFEKTGMALLEHDGSYPGDIDITPRLPLQKGALDSRWAQWRIITDFYKWCRANGIYLNVPDYYYLSGSNKCGMGYRESNWSLPRAQQVIHTRQNIYDGSWTKNTTMGWMFVPLTQYQGGGAAATIEPLKDHLNHYQQMISSNLTAGTQACYRGPRLYDAVQTRDMLKAQVNWFKKHRQTLEGDLIHLKRPDGINLDYWLMVNPIAREKGIFTVFNPLDKPITQKIKVNVYYTGLSNTLTVTDKKNNSKIYPINRTHHIFITVTVAPQSQTSYILTQ